MSVVSFIERRVSPIVTTGLAILGLPNRKALAKSLGEQVKLRSLVPAQLEALRLLLVDHDIIQEKPQTHSIDQLKHFHLSKTLTWRRINRFVISFNQIFSIEGLEISLSRRQFSISRTEAIQAALADVEASAWAKIAGVLIHAGLPLTLTEIEAELFEPRDQIAEELGAARENGRIIRTYAEEGLEPRYYLASRDAEMMGRSVLVFRSSETAARIFKRDAERLRQADRACKVITSGGVMEFISAKYLAEHLTEFVPVKARFENFLAVAADTSKLLEQGLLVVGLETESSEPSYILASRQKQYLAEIFRSFAGRYIDVNDSESYQKLEAVFKLARAKAAHAPVENLLMIANQVAKLGGRLNAIILALCPDEADITKLAATRLFTPEEIAHLEDCQRRAHYVFHHPLLVNFGFSYGLRNLFHAWYDKLGHLAVLQVVLSRKLLQLRQIAENGAALPLNLKYQIEVLYAPLAESKGYLDLANDLRDLVFRITKPLEYADALARQERDLGMPRPQAVRHLEAVAAKIADELKSQGGKITSALNRLKEVYATVGKDDHFDDCGIRFTCRSLAEAKELIRLLNKTYARPAELGLELSKEEEADYLDKPNQNGWRGWRCYFVDPTQTDFIDRPRILSVQVLTDRMQKEDKMGQAGHWFYKACRAARKMFEELGWKHWRNQAMDQPPIDRYNGEPKHDFKIDVEIARQQQTVYFEAESFDLSGQKAAPALRLSNGDAIEDLLAFRSLGPRLIERLLFVELYVLKIDALGRTSLSPWQKGQARVPPGTKIPRPDRAATLLALVKEEKAFAESALLTRLRKAKGAVRSPRARFLIERYLCSAKQRQTLAAAGADLAQSYGIETVFQAEEVRQFAELAPGELNEALALDILPAETVKQILGSLKPIVNLRPIGGQELELTVHTPDQPGLWAEITRHLKQSSILSAVSHSIPHARRASLHEVALKLQSTDPEAKAIDLVGLQARLDQLAKERSEKTWPQTTFVHQVELTILPRENNWDSLRPILPAIAELGLNIIAVNLPPISAARDEVGIITLEIESNSENPAEELALLKLELAQKARGLEFGLLLVR